MKRCIKNIIFILSLFSSIFLINDSTYAQNQDCSIVNGLIIDNSTLQGIPYAHITLLGSGISSVSNEFGEFEFKIPLISLRDSLLFTSIGYENYCIAFSDINLDKELNIKLAPRTYEIDEIKIVGKGRRISPKSIVRQAIAKIPDNYPFYTYQIQGYYRDYLKHNDQYLNLLEAGLVIEDPGFQYNDAKSKVKILQLRYSDDYAVDLSLNLTYQQNQKELSGFKFPAYGGNELTILRAHNPIRNYNDFSFSFIDIFSKDFIRNHEFTLDSISYYADIPVYCIGFRRYYTVYKDPWLAVKNKYTIRGSIFISSDNMGILKLVYSNFSSTNEVSNRKIYELQLEYREHQGKLFLNYISFLNLFEIEDIGREGGFDITEEQTPYYQFREFFVNKIATIEFLPLADSELCNNDEPLYNQLFTPDYPFWDKFNIVKLQDISNKLVRLNKASFSDYLTEKLDQFNTKFPKENLFVHLDKNIYQPGDTIWLKAYILDYSTNHFTNLSNTIYTYIYNNKGNLLTEKKFLLSPKGSIGDIVLSDTIQEGYYKLVAYSSWMKNYKPENVFMCDFEIRHIFNRDFNAKLLYEECSYEQGDTLKAWIQLTTVNNKPLSNISYKYELLISNEKLLEGKGKTSRDGKGDIQLLLPKLEGKPAINLTFSWKGIEIEKEYAVPFSFNKIDLQFFPEGGDLVDGLKSRVAFKATDFYGQPVDVQGEILDENSELIKTFQTTYKGMGDFYITPIINREFYIKINTPEGSYETFSLPLPKPKGLILVLNSVDSTSLQVKIKSSQPNKEERICILLQMRGVKYYAIEGNIKDEALITIPTTKIPAGVASITLFNNNIPVAERMVFINKHRKLNINVTTNKEVYLPREQVTATIEVTDENGLHVPALLSLAVTDLDLSHNSQFKKSNIYSYILLESELQGSIPTPEYYFSEGILPSKALDLVMMTNGWRRFSWESVLSMNNKSPEPIAFDMVSGTVIKKNGKPASYANLTVTQFNPPRINEIYTNGEGRFRFNYQLIPERPNKIGFVAKSARGRKNVEIIIDEHYKDSFNIKVNNIIKKQNVNLFQYYQSNCDTYQFKNTNEPIEFYDTRFIPEVSIIRKERNTKESIETHYAKVFGHYKQGKDLNPNLPIEFWILDIHPQALLMGGNVVFRRSSINFSDHAGFNYGPPLIVLDGRYRGVTFSDLRMFESEQIESIGTLDGNDAFMMFGEIGNYGAIIVSTNKNYIRKFNKDKNISFLNVYAPVREFYSPKYDTENRKNNQFPDLRTTIYWEPNIETNESGITSITFYNADRLCRIQGVIQGVGSNLLGSAEFYYDIK